MSYVNNKGADQPAHPHSLISAFVVHCLDSIISRVSISEISSLYLASVAAQSGLCLTWSQTLKTGFLVTRLIIIVETSIFANWKSLYVIYRVSEYFYFSYAQNFMYLKCI